jgi:glutathione S-transferase
MLGRAQRALDRLAQEVSTRAPGPLCGSWSMADMALVALVLWFETMPTRAATFPPAKTMLSLGYAFPAALSAWADQHRGRADVRALDG